MTHESSHKSIIAGRLGKKILIWILLTESMLILSTRLGAFLHEFVGHGLTARLIGGRFESFRLTLFAGGEAQFSGDFGRAATIIVSLGGILINLVTGLFVLWLVKRRKLSFSFTLFGLLLAGVSILSQLQYLSLGAYYQYSDLACLSGHPSIMFLAWSGGLLALAFFSFSLMSIFFRFQETYFPSSNLFSRAVITFLLLGLPVLVYTGFYHLGQTPLGSTAAIMEARVQAEKEAERIQIETGQSFEEIKKQLEPYPLLPWILAIYFLTTVAAFLRPVRKTAYLPPLPSSLLATLPWLIGAGSALALIALLW